MSDRDTRAEVIEDAAAGITARSCGYGSCDRMRGHDGPHRCRCSKPVDAPANGCKWHTSGPTDCPHDSRSGADGRWRCDQCGADCGPNTYLTPTEEGDRV